MTYPLNNFPAAVRNERLVIDRRQVAQESPFTSAMQTTDGGSQWQLEWDWPAMTHADAVRVGAWLNSLKGQVGSFRYRPRQPFDTSSLGGRALATIGYQYNTSVLIGGWAANAASNLFLGQYIQIGDQLLTITAAGATADASGRVLIDFEPRLRLTFPVSTPVNLVNPAGLFRLASSAGAGFTLDPDRRPTFGTIAAREVI